MQWARGGPCSKSTYVRTLLCSSNSRESQFRRPTIGVVPPPFFKSLMVHIGVPIPGTTLPPFTNPTSPTPVPLPLLLLIDGWQAAEPTRAIRHSVSTQHSLDWLKLLARHGPAARAKKIARASPDFFRSRAMRRLKLLLCRRSPRRCRICRQRRRQSRRRLIVGKSSVRWSSVRR